MGCLGEEAEIHPDNVFQSVNSSTQIYLRIFVGSEQKKLFLEFHALWPGSLFWNINFSWTAHFPDGSNNTREWVTLTCLKANLKDNRNAMVSGLMRVSPLCTPLLLFWYKLPPALAWAPNWLPHSSQRDSFHVYQVISALCTEFSKDFPSHSWSPFVAEKVLLKGLPNLAGSASQ